jgi:hypothetical protein
VKHIISLQLQDKHDFIVDLDLGNRYLKTYILDELQYQDISSKNL